VQIWEAFCNVSAFVLQVKPDRIQEYTERHRSVWPEMKKALQETGWNNYSLFLRSDRIRFRSSTCWHGASRGQSELATRNGEFFVQPKGVLPDRAMAPLEEALHV